MCIFVHVYLSIYIHMYMHMYTYVFLSIQMYNTSYHTCMNATTPHSPNPPPALTLDVAHCAPMRRVN